MAWLLTGTSHLGASRLRTLLKARETIAVPGVFNPLSALLAERAGFDALYLSGAALSASLALPDLGVLTMDELVGAARAIARVSSLPLLVDIDTGYGETLNIVRLTRELEEIGVAAVQIEDQEMPKRCGHLEGKHLISADEMVARLNAIRFARRELLIIARTDARGVTGLEDAIARARAYAANGADIIFPEGLQNEDEFAAFRRALTVPLLANMTEFGKTPHLTLAQFQALGYALVIYPVSSLRLAARAMAEGYALLRATGTLREMLPRMLTRQELYELIEYAAHEEIARQCQRPSIKM